MGRIILFGHTPLLPLAADLVTFLRLVLLAAGVYAGLVGLQEAFKRVHKHFDFESFRRWLVKRWSQ